MNMNRFTEKAQEALVDAQQRAQNAGNPEVSGLHLLASLLNRSGGIVSAILPLVNVNPTDLLRRVEQDLAALPRVTGATEPPNPSGDFRSAMQRAQGLASEMGINTSPWSTCCSHWQIRAIQVGPASCCEWPARHQTSSTRPSNTRAADSGSLAPTPKEGERSRLQGAVAANRTRAGRPDGGVRLAASRVGAGKER
jgi:hypothetical protein